MLKQHFLDNSGDENIQKMIWISIAFIVGSIILAIVTAAFRGPIANWFNNKVEDWFNNSNGVYNDGGSSSSAPDVSNGHLGDLG